MDVSAVRLSMVATWATCQVLENKQDENIFWIGELGDTFNILIVKRKHSNLHTTAAIVVSIVTTVQLDKYWS